MSAHGVKWISHAYFSREEEKKIINDCYSSILAFWSSPVGWHTKSSTSPFTRDLLIEHGGFIYDSNAYNDDIPFVLKNDQKLLLFHIHLIPMT